MGLLEIVDTCLGYPVAAGDIERAVTAETTLLMPEHPLFLLSARGARCIGRVPGSADETQYLFAIRADRAGRGIVFDPYDRSPEIYILVPENRLTAHWTGYPHNPQRIP